MQSTGYVGKYSKHNHVGKNSKYNHVGKYSKYNHVGKTVNAITWVDTVNRIM